MASPLDLFGFGSRANGMAGSVAATASGPEANYYSPAALAFDESPSFFVGFQRADFFLEINGEEREILGAPATTIGIAIPIPFGSWLENRISIGLGFVIPTTSLLIADIPRPGEARFALVESRAQTISLLGNLGVRVLDWLALGVGTLALAELNGAIDVAPNQAGQLSANVRDEVIADYALVVSIAARPTDWISASATYRTQSAARFELPITVDLGETFALPVPLLDISGTAQFDPAQLAIDVGGRPIPDFDGFVVNATFVWKQWSTYPNPIVYTAVPEDFPEQPTPNFEDTFGVKIGVEADFQVADWTLSPRAGYAYEPTPIPEQSGFHNYLDNDRHISAVGFGASWSLLRIEAALQWHVMPERSNLKDVSSVSEDNPGFPEITHGGSVLFWGLEIGVEL